MRSERGEDSHDVRGGVVPVCSGQVVNGQAFSRLPVLYFRGRHETPSHCTV